MTGADPIIHQDTRLRIMASLNRLGGEAMLDFTSLKSILETTDGNLGTHLDTLEKAGYVAIEKLFEGRRPKTRVKATPAGRRAVAEHVAYLRSIIEGGKLIMKRFLLAAAMLFASGAANAAGYTTAYAPYGESGALEVAVWYPSDVKPVALHLGPFDMTVAPDAAPTAGMKPLIVISHGTGGSSMNMYDTAIALADAGFVVAAPLQAGDNYRDHAVSFTRQNFAQRPGQVGRVIDYLTTGWAQHGSVDAGRIGVLGHSAGGTTALLLAGGTLEWKRVIARCKNDLKDWDCIEARKHPGSADETVTGNVTGADPRVKAIMVAAPALADGFFPHGVDAVTIPVSIWAGARDPIVKDDNELHTMFGSRANYHLIPDAGHFAYLTPCTAMLKSIAPDICTDPAGFNRTAFLESFRNAAITYFKDNLK